MNNDSDSDVNKVIIEIIILFFVAYLVGVLFLGWGTSDEENERSIDDYGWQSPGN